MNFDLEEAEKQIREKVKRLFTGDAAAEPAQMDVASTDQVRRIVRRWLGLLKDTGYLSSSTLNEHDSVSLAMSRAQLATLAPALFLSVEVSARIFGRLVSCFGNEDQKRDLLPDLMEGKIIGAVALSENGVNMENEPFRTEGVPEKGGFRVTGFKEHGVNAPIADWIAVAGNIHGRDDIAFFLVKKEQKGIFTGPRLATLGYEGVPISSVALNACPVPSRHVIYAPREISVTVRRWEDQVLTAAALGLMERSYEAALKHAKTHHSGGKPIMHYQEIGFKLAEMLTLCQTARLLTCRAAWMSQTDHREADVLAHGAKVFCTESAEKVASEALQILGKKGYVRKNPVEAGYRDAKYLQIAGTSTEISRMKMGDRILEFK